MLRLHAAARLLAAAHRRQRQGRGGGGGPLRGDVVPRHEERRLASTSQSCRLYTSILGYLLKPDLRRVGDHGDFQLKFLVFEHYASLK